MDFAELVETESRPITAAVVGIVGDWARAEEIVQDAFERCHARWRRVSRMDRPGAWVRRVAINAAISVHRRDLGEQRALERLTAFRSSTPPDPLAAIADSQLWAAVRALPRDQAAAIALHYAADLSIDDTAATLGVTASAVKSLLHRGRATLRTSELLREDAAHEITTRGGPS